MTFHTEQIGNARLILGDCAEVMASWPECFRVDAVVTDPPYGISDKPLAAPSGRQGKLNTWHPERDWDYSIDPAWPAMCGRVSPLVAWFGHWRKRGEVEAAMPHKLRAEIVWAKDCHVGPPCPVAMRDERIWLFSDKGIKGACFETSVWDSPVIPTWAFKHHKNEKPVRLMKRLLTFLDPTTCLDPFMGSGSTGVAAIQQGRNFIGIEQSEQHFESACRRIREANGDDAGPLFGEVNAA